MALLLGSTKCDNDDHIVIQIHDDNGVVTDIDAVGRQWRLLFNSPTHQLYCASPKEWEDQHAWEVVLHEQLFSCNVRCKIDYTKVKNVPATAIAVINNGTWWWRHPEWKRRSRELRNAAQQLPLLKPLSAIVIGFVGVVMSAVNKRL